MPEAQVSAIRRSPSTYQRYSLWDIEPMFSDFKSRGFRFQDTHLQRTDRISRMLLVLAIALTWATANGQAIQKNARSWAA